MYPSAGGAGARRQVPRGGDVVHPPPFGGNASRTQHEKSEFTPVEGVCVRGMGMRIGMGMG